MKNWGLLIILLTLAAVGCSLSSGAGSQDNTDSRPIIQENRPTIVLLAPQSENRYALNSEVLLYAEAYDPAGKIAKIEFYDNFDTIIGTVNAQNPDGDTELTGMVAWRANAVQRHFLKAKAFRADGTKSNVQEVSIEVVSLESAPSTDNQASATPPASNITPTAATSAPSPQPAITNTASAALDIRLDAVVTGAATLNVRSAPNIGASVLRSVAQGASLELVGRSADNQWYATALQDGSFGWVFGQYLDIDGDPTTLPLVAAQ